MANMCSNSVCFHGDEDAVKKVRQLFKNMSYMENVTNKGQMPTFLKFNDGYFFDIYADDTQDNILYETRWSPNTKVLIAIANKYKVSFDYEYSEMGNPFYGRAFYENGILTEKFLERKDFDRYTADELREHFTLDTGEIFENEYELLDKLLEEK